MGALQQLLVAVHLLRGCWTRLAQSALSYPSCLISLVGETGSQLLLHCGAIIAKDMKDDSYCCIWIICCPARYSGDIFFIKELAILIGKLSPLGIGLVLYLKDRTTDSVDKGI